MTIEWIPPVLQQAVEHPCSKRARNDGHAMILDEKGSIRIRLRFEGSVLHVTRAVQLYLGDRPHAFAQVFETTRENPSPFPFKEPEPEVEIPGYCHVRFQVGWTDPN